MGTDFKAVRAFWGDGDAFPLSQSPLQSNGPAVPVGNLWQTDAFRCKFLINTTVH